MWDIRDYNGRNVEESGVESNVDFDGVDEDISEANINNCSLEIIL